MMAEMFRIAGQNIRIAGGSFCRLLSGFEVPAENQTDTDVCRVSLTEGYTQFDISSVTPDHPVEHVFSIHSCPGHFMVSDGDYTNSTALVVKPREEGVMELFLAALYSHMAGRARTVFVHASLVEMPGQGGVMFVGRSGIGKTTQARLWEQFRGAEIINGDKVFLTLDEDGRGVTAHGSPWCGSSPYKLNRATPLRGIVVLDQAPGEQYPAAFRTRDHDAVRVAYFPPHVGCPPDRLCDGGDRRYDAAGAGLASQLSPGSGGGGHDLECRVRGDGSMKDAQTGGESPLPAD